MSQSNSVANNVFSAFSLDQWVTGIFLACLTAVVILGGVKSISGACSVIVPVMAVVYVAVGLFAIVLNIGLLPKALATIMGSAFSLQAGFGGLIGTTIRYGVARGVFSNEAGLGSAPIAAAAAYTDHPCRQALVSMTGTFLDTIVVCTVNGLILVMAGLYAETTGDMAASLTSRSFALFLPRIGEIVVTISLIFFAYSTILGWSYYGERCLYYLTESKTISFVYRLVFSIFVLVGATIKLGLVWDISDTFNGAMAIPNLLGLLALSGVIVQQTRDFRARFLDPEREAANRG
jgi:AGCS family alanine or glycine:cation symporter